MFLLARSASLVSRAARTPLVRCALQPKMVVKPLSTTSRLLNDQQSNQRQLPQGQTRAAVQKLAPHWKADGVVDGELKKVSINDYRGKFLVMVFYPADFTFVCPTELLAFSDRLDEFHKLGAEVVGISVDNVHSHLAWTNLPREKGGVSDLRIPLVSDIRRTISMNYNVLLTNAGVSLRGLFIVDTKGILRIAHVNDLPIGRSVDETLRLIEAIQFTDEHGEVCPANWKKGDKTIKPNPKDAGEYFAAVN